MVSYHWKFGLGFRGPDTVLRHKVADLLLRLAAVVCGCFHFANLDGNYVKLRSRVKTYNR
jgi:hypothetical protein